MLDGDGTRYFHTPRSTGERTDLLGSRVHRSGTEGSGERGWGVEVGGWGCVCGREFISHRYTVTTRMISALRWAAICEPY